MKSAALEREPAAANEQAAAADFSRVAGVYRWMEWLTFGPLLWRCRCAFLGAMGDRKRALVLGDGDGRFTARLLASNTEIHVEAIDASEAMLQQLRGCAARYADRLRARAGDARTLIFLSGGYDLVVTHFFLDCLTSDEVESLAFAIAPRLDAEAVWVVSEFAIPDNLYGRLFARPLVSALYFAFRVLTGLGVGRLPRYREALERAGLVLRQQQTRLCGLLVSEMWQARGGAR